MSLRRKRLTGEDLTLPGYTTCIISGVSLSLPDHVIKQLQEERRQAEQAAATAYGESAPKADEQAEPAPAPSPDEPAQGFHRVLHRLEAQTAGAEDDTSLAIRSSDSDVRARHRLLRERLLELGPDRRVGQPAGWQAALDALEQDMPNFEAPIGFVRHALSAAEATGSAARLPPMLLLGPPGVGKTYFSQRLAELLEVPHATVAFDQPMAANTLRGSDQHWSNTQAGLLFNLLCLGDTANPVILLDEVDKASADSLRVQDPLAQLLSVLEPQTARCLQDISTGIAFDASLVSYIATANSLRRITPPLLSRFEVIDIQPPTNEEAVVVAKRVIEAALQRFKVADRLTFDRRCAYVLARLSPRLMRRTVDRLVAAALHDRKSTVTEEQVWAALGMSDSPRLH